MPYDPNWPEQVYGFVIIDPEGDRPYFCHRLPLEYARAKGAKIFGFMVPLWAAPFVVPPGKPAGHGPLGVPQHFLSGWYEADAYQIPVKIVSDIVDERQRQDAKYPVTYPDGTGTDEARRAAELLRMVCDDDADAGRCTFASILAEEVAEAFAEDDRAKLRAELVQVAAVCVKWIQVIDQE